LWAAHNGQVELSVREAEVLDLVAERLTNAEIARKLYVSVRTVESHVSSLLRKLGLPDRRALAAYSMERQQASELGWRSLGEPSTSFVGRQPELAEMAAAVAKYPLVSLVGPGGVGKTRLALRFAGQTRAVFADLAVLPASTDAETVARAVAAALGLPEPVDSSALEVVAAELSAVPCLLVLDNCEHLLDGVAAVAERLLRAGSSHLLATSRERLSVPGEHVIAVEPLSEQLAVQLFLERAGSAGATEELASGAISELCRRLECLPLLVELAAARLSAFSLPDLLSRIDHALELLGSGGRSSHRHRSVLATLAWSYDLLTPAEQAVYRSLSVLRGPFRLATGEAVVPPGPPGSVAAHLARLVDASLLVRVGDRYRKSQLVRADAAERLRSAGEQNAARRRLVDWALETAAIGILLGDDVDLKAAVEAAEELGHPGLARLAEMLAEHFEAASQWTDAQALYELAARSSQDARSAIAAAELATARSRGDSALRLFGFAADLAAACGDADLEVEALEGVVELTLRYPGLCINYPSTEEVEAILGRAEQRSRSVPPGSRRAAMVTVGRAWQQWGLGTSVRPLGDGSDEGAGSRNVAQPADLAVAMAEASGDQLLLSSALDCRSSGLLRNGDIAGAMVAASRRVAFLSDLRDDSAHARQERRDALSMASAGALRMGDFGTSMDYALRYRELELASREPHGGLQAVIPAQFFLGLWDELIGDATHLFSVRQQEVAWGAGHLTEPWVYAGAVLGYRGQTEQAEQWYGRAEFSGDHHLSYRWLMRCLRADVELHHGRAAQAQDFLRTRSQDTDGWWRSLYAVVRAEAFGGDEIDEAAALVGGDAHAAAVLARAQGKLEVAQEGFRKCGAVYQWARTTLQMGGPDVDEALATYEALGLKT
jgi:predicted ATPase/DNA-binding CsgD family transcriptional regulator